MVGSDFTSLGLIEGRSGCGLGDGVLFFGVLAELGGAVEGSLLALDVDTLRPRAREDTRCHRVGFDEVVGDEGSCGVTDGLADLEEVVVRGADPSETVLGLDVDDERDTFDPTPGSCFGFAGSDRDWDLVCVGAGDADIVGS